MSCTVLFLNDHASAYVEQSIQISVSSADASYSANWNSSVLACAPMFSFLVNSNVITCNSTQAGGQSAMYFTANTNTMYVSWSTINGLANDLGCYVLGSGTTMFTLTAQMCTDLYFGIQNSAQSQWQGAVVAMCASFAMSC